MRRPLSAWRAASQGICALLRRWAACRSTSAAAPVSARQRNQTKGVLMARITWFEFFVDDTDTEIAFYKKAFGWESQKWGDMPYFLVMTGDKSQAGIDGAIAKPPMENMTQRVVNTMSVDDNDAATKMAAEAGATVVVPKMAVPGSGWLTYLADPAGIVFGIMQYDPNAK
jgi:uncharacterized protein